MGVSPGIVVMGGDSHARGRGFESQCMNEGLFKISSSWVEALVLWLWEKTSMQEVVGSNLSTGYWIKIFTLL